MNVAPTELDPSRQLHPETLGSAARGARLRNRRVLVVGAGQRDMAEETPPIGNGRAISVLCAREGATVGCIDISAAAAADTVAHIAREGGAAWAEVADVRDAAAIAPLVQR